MEGTKLNKNSASPNRVKLQFELNPADGHGYQTEGIWAESLGQNEFRILNSPFFVFGLSLDDVVRAKSHDGVYRFEEVVRRGGHSTYRLFLQNNNTIHDAAVREELSKLEKQGGILENANDRLLVVDVPPSSDISAIYKLLEQGEAEGLWVFEEGHYSGGATN